MRDENKLLQLARQEARQRSKDQNIKHCNALDQIAKEFGFSNWARFYEVQKNIKD